MPSTWTTEDHFKLLISIVMSSSAHSVTRAEWTEIAENMSKMGGNVTNEACRQQFLKLRKTYEPQLKGTDACGSPRSPASKTTPKPRKRVAKTAPSGEEDDEESKPAKRTKRSTKDKPMSAEKVKVEEDAEEDATEEVNGASNGDEEITA